MNEQALIRQWEEMNVTAAYGGWRKVTKMNLV
jgi:hypothetical protein